MFNPIHTPGSTTTTTTTTTVTQQTTVVTPGRTVQGRTVILVPQGQSSHISQSAQHQITDALLMQGQAPVNPRGATVVVIQRRDPSRPDPRISHHGDREQIGRRQ